MGSIWICSTGAPEGTATWFVAFPAQPATSARQTIQTLFFIAGLAFSLRDNAGTGQFPIGVRAPNVYRSLSLGHRGGVPLREVIPAPVIAHRVAELGAEIDRRLP